MAEKEFLMRKVQFLQHYGSVVPSSLDSGGFFTENRSNLRKGGDLKVHRDLQKLNVRFFFLGTFISQLISLINTHFLRNENCICSFIEIAIGFFNHRWKILMMMFSIPKCKKCWKRFYGHVNCPLNNFDENQSQYFLLTKKK